MQKRLNTAILVLCLGITRVLALQITASLCIHKSHYRYVLRTYEYMLSNDKC